MSKNESNKEILTFEATDNEGKKSIKGKKPEKKKTETKTKKKAEKPVEKPVKKEKKSEENKTKSEAEKKNTEEKKNSVTKKKSAPKKKNETEKKSAPKKNSTAQKSEKKSGDKWNIKQLGGYLFAKMMRGGASELQAKAEEVNQLNVFPVPDGDTGDNMSMTIQSGVASLDNIDTDDLAEVLKVFYLT